MRRMPAGSEVAPGGEDTVERGTVPWSGIESRILGEREGWRYWNLDNCAFAPGEGVAARTPPPSHQAKARLSKF
jgi:hypothetical protein